MSGSGKSNPEVQPKPERRRFGAEYKRRIVMETSQCRHGESGSLLRREGLTYAQIGKWRMAYEAGTLEKKQGSGREPESCGNASSVSRECAFEAAVGTGRTDHRGPKKVGTPAGGAAIMSELASKIGVKRACAVLECAGREAVCAV